MEEIEAWLVRDEDNTLMLVIGAKPVKYSTFWMLLLSKSMIQLNNSLFPEVKWSDDEPTKVKLEIVK